ncbi:MAG: Ig-like domain-containing protein, partial [Actinomycetia bacterium]|nr:Ig-like domain-containing protein [Actinomycetes bacterium]
VAPTPLGSWTLTARSMPLGQPTVLAALGDCGDEERPVMRALDPLSAGHLPVGDNALTVIPVATSVPAAPDDHSSALVTVRADSDPARVADLIAAAQSGGYAAIVFDTDSALTAQLFLLGAVPMAAGAYPAIPWLYVDAATADELRAMAAAGNPTWHVLQRSGAEYVYALGQALDASVAAPFAVVADSSHMGTIGLQVRPFGASVDAYISYMAVAGRGSAGGLVATPSTQEAYVEPGDWVVEGDFYQTDPVSTTDMVWPTIPVVSRPVSVAAGQRASIVLGSPLLSSGTSPDNYTQITWDGAMLRVPSPLLVDSYGNHQAFGLWGLAGAENVNVTLTDTTTGEWIAMTDGWEIDMAATEVHTYRLATSTTHDVTIWPFGSAINTTWTWKSTPNTSGTPVPEPVRMAWYELPGLDAQNQGAASQLVVLHVGQQDGSAALPIAKVTLAMSTDRGATWTDVPVKKAATPPAGSIGAVAGEDLYAGTIEAAVGGIVWLKTSVTGGSSTLTQTVADAYPVVATPAGFPASLAFACTALPAAPRIDAANATVVAGTAGSALPGGAITVTWPDGSTTTTTVKDDGSWSVRTPPGMASGEVSVTVADAKGRTSKAATATLDSVVPAAPVLAVTNGSVVSGTAEPGSTVTVTDDTGNAVSGCVDVPVGPDGTFACTPTPPVAPGATLTVRVSDPAGNVSARATVKVVDRTLAVANPAPAAGESQTVVGTGWTPGETVTITLDGTSVGTAKVAADGTFSLTFTMPASTVKAHTLIASGSASSKAWAADISLVFGVGIHTGQTGGAVTNTLQAVSGAAAFLLVAASLSQMVTRRQREAARVWGRPGRLG